MAGGDAVPPARPAWWRTSTGITVLGFALVAAFYVLREHYAHALGLLPYLIILACPLLHLFGHGRHGRNGNHRQSAGAEGDVARSDKAGLG
ncbi:hypothetical protein DFH01_25470 [Falsiroseomonas bella]|uniref:DUF2933 domain-containing protein n=1 Tax=Falsiroseomonas bella TaxID=2184016 RepID=A0A317F7B7_9PROT|nr:DUF2933 domain-containing protein [Falsiroseomonas bella]PWS34372.1 hypothetical protein DFH01_25470 [Falsiroseomonas bella]